MTAYNDGQCDKHGVQWQTSEIGDECPICKLEETLGAVKQYLEENHAERIKYPEYIEFHILKKIMNELWKGGEG